MTRPLLCARCLQMLELPDANRCGLQVEWIPATAPDSIYTRLAHHVGLLDSLLAVIDEYGDVPDAMVRVSDRTGRAAGLLADTTVGGTALCRWHVLPSRP